LWVTTCVPWTRKKGSLCQHQLNSIIDCKINSIVWQESNSDINDWKNNCLIRH
jgi:hypothetical protein